MKNSTDDGFDQHYNVQVAVDQESVLVVSNSLSNHANDQREALPTVDAIDHRVGKPEASGTRLWILQPNKHRRSGSQRGRSLHSNRATDAS